MDGHNLNLFRVEGCNTPRHLYKLVRGVTSTIIQDVSFSPDNKFIAVTSGRGTSHVFAISVEGSQASVETHVNDGGMSLVDTPPSTPLEGQQARSPTTVFTLLRMKAHTHNGGSSSGPPPPASGSGQCCARYTSDGRAVYMVSGEGVLTLYNVAPVAKVDEETQQEVLSLETECQGTFNICRRQHWGEQRASQERLAHWSNGAARVPIVAGHTAKSACVPLTEQQAAELVCLEMEGGDFCLIEEGTPDTRPTTHVRAMAAAAAATKSGKGSSQDAWDDDWEEDSNAPAPATAPEKVTHHNQMLEFFQSARFMAEKGGSMPCYPSGFKKGGGWGGDHPPFDIFCVSSPRSSCVLMFMACAGGFQQGQETFEEGGGGGGRHIRLLRGGRHARRPR